MTLLFALLAALSVFFGCVGVWPAQAGLRPPSSPPFTSPRFRAPVRRARLRSIR